LAQTRGSRWIEQRSEVIDAEEIVVLLTYHGTEAHFMAPVPEVRPCNDLSIGIHYQLLIETRTGCFGNQISPAPLLLSRATLINFCNCVEILIGFHVLV
jgi:hypothetical protein